MTGNNAVVMDLNTLAWVSSRTLLGGARYSASVTIPFARNQLTSDLHGPISGGGGLADSFYMPFILGWSKQYAVRAIYGVLAPTGSFTAGGSDNVGSGYWTSTISSGQTIYPTKTKQLALSAYEMYEFHTTQEGTATKPGDTFDLDYSVFQTLPAGGDARASVPTESVHRSGAVLPTPRLPRGRRGKVSLVAHRTEPGHSAFDEDPDENLG